MADQYVGEIRPVAFTFAPLGWALCNGQLLSIAQNTALFSLLGTYYGGDGRSTFALPNLQDRVPVDMGTGPGLTTLVLGEDIGSDTETLIVQQIPAHSHALHAVSGAADMRSESNALPAEAARSVYGTTPLASTLNANSITTVGANQPHENRQPTLYVNYVIALQGIFPPRG